MKRDVTTIINPEKCTGCGRCLSVCPSGTLSMVDGKAKVTGDESLGCGHCAAICPVGAITVKANNAAMSFNTFDSNHYLAPGRFDPSSLAALMRSRRSCRNYTAAPVSKKLLDDLVTFAITAPSGTNSQQWTFTTLGLRNDVAQLGNLIAKWYVELNHKAKKPFLRLYAKLFLKDSLGNYYRNYYQSVQKALDDWQKNGTDHLFHGASAVIIIGSKPEASCGHDDALLAAQNINLAAHALGLGSCMIGFAVHAINRSASIKKQLQIPANEEVFACIALGYSGEKYIQPTGRKTPLMRSITFDQELTK